MSHFRTLPLRCVTRCPTRWIGSLLLPALLYAPMPVSAAIYKCTDPDGSVTYSQSPCANQQQSAGVFASQSAPTQDCRIAQSFASDVAGRMKRGDSSQAQFQRFGGMQAIPATSMGLISYIYTYKGEDDVPATRIAALATARCETRSFGPAGCDDFPYAWIEDMGGCAAAADPALRARAPAEQAAAGYAPTPGERYGDAVPAAAMAVESPTACENRIRDQIDSLRERMRQPSSVQAQNSLNQRRNELRRALLRCR